MKAVIQAGGKGTRILNITNDKIPKPMLLIDDKPILYYQIMNLKRYNIKDIIIIVCHLGDIIKDYFKDGKKLGVNISYIEEDESNPLGTAGSFYYLKNNIDDDFIFLLGDVFVDINFDRFINYHKKYKKDITLLVHPNSHPYDSDLIITEGNIVKGINYKNIKRNNYCNLVNAGVMIFSNKCLSLIKKPIKYNYEKDIVCPMIKKNRVIAYKSTEYVKDIGTDDRYYQVIKDYNSNIIQSRNLSNLQKCIFLDRDGTINKHVGFLKNVDDLELISGVDKAIRKINDSGFLCIVITNQPVVARGDVTFDELEEIHRKLETLLGDSNAYVDDLLYCPHHPDKGYEGEVSNLKIKCNCRKPNIGLIEEAVKRYNIDISKSYFIGDTTTDIECAKRANIKSVLVKSGEIDNKYKVVADYEFDSLEEAVNTIVGW